MSNVVVEYNGVTYPSMKDFADAYGISISLVDGRRRRGWSWDKIVNTPLCGKREKDTIEVNGKIYKGVCEFARALNISAATVSYRRKSGWSWEKIAATPVSAVALNVVCDSYEYKGVKYKSLRALAQALDINQTVLASRLNEGLTIEEAVEKPAEKFNIRYNGKDFKGVKPLAKELGVTACSLRQWLKDGLSLESILEKVDKCKSRGQEINYRGEHYNSVTDFALAVGMDRGLVYKRLSIGLSPEEVVALPYGVPITKLGELLDRGKTLQQAMDNLLNDSECFYSIIRYNKDISHVKSLCNNKFALITCKVCGRRVLLPRVEAMSFTHSDNCIRNEWL